jgi:hypothetical protein
MRALGAWRRSDNILLARVKDLLVIIPAFHLATCVIYLFFYYSAFGVGLAYFASPTDIFAVSLADVAPGYVWLILGLTLSHFAFRSNWRENRFRFETLDPEDQERLRPRAKSVLRILYWGIGILLAQSGMIALLDYIATGYVNTFFAAIFAQLAVISVSTIALHRLNLTKTTYDILSNAGVIVVALATSGASDAQIDKHLRYSEMLSPSAMCGQMKIRKRVSEYWLAVSPDNGRYLVDDNCDRKFVVVQGQQFSPLSVGAPSEHIATLL